MKKLPQSGGSYTVDAKGGLKQTVAPPKPAPQPKPSQPPKSAPPAKKEA